MPLSDTGVVRPLFVLPHRHAAGVNGRRRSGGGVAGEGVGGGGDASEEADESDASESEESAETGSRPLE